MYLLSLTRQVVDISTIQQQVTIDGVTERRHVARERHARPNIAPQGTGCVYSHFRVGDVRCDAEIRQPEIFNLFLSKQLTQKIVERAT